MAAARTGDDTPDKKNTSGAPHIKHTAEQYLNVSPRGTSSWQMLKDLRLSIVDEGVNALKQGISRITGVFGTTAPTHHDQPVPRAEVNSADAGPPGQESARSRETGAQSVATTNGSVSESVAVANDWMDNLLNNLMSSVEPLESDQRPSQRQQGEPEQSTGPHRTGRAGDKAADKPGGTATPHLKQTAQQYIDVSPRGTSSWQLLKDLRVSIVDGGMNVLKSGMGKLSGAARSAGAGKAESGAAPSQDSETRLGATTRSDVNATGMTQPQPVEANNAVKSHEGSQTQAELLGGDWVDHLIDSFAENASPTEMRNDLTAEGFTVGAQHTLVERDEHRAITKIAYPIGTSTTIAYDENDFHRPTTIIRSDGQEWRREGSSWYEYQFGIFTGEILRGDFVIGDDGSVIKKSAAGDALEEWLPNGDKLECPVDQPHVKKHSDGTILELRYPARDAAEPVVYKYTQGQLMEVETANGKPWKRQADGMWQQHRGRPQNLQLKTSQCGDCLVLKNTRIIAVQHRDGSDTRLKWNGEKVWERNGHAIEIVHPDGSYSQIDRDGIVKKDKHHRLITGEPASAEL